MALARASCQPLEVPNTRALRPAFYLLLSALAFGAGAPRTFASEAGARVAASPSEATRARFAGSWRFVGGAQEVAARDAAVEKSIASLFFAIRGLARSRIKSTVEIRQKVSFSFSGGNVVFKATGARDLVSPDDGRPVPFKGEDGNTVQLTQLIGVDGRLEQTLRTDEGGHSTFFAALADNKIMRATHRIFSPKLKEPIVYTLTYQRE